MDHIKRGDLSRPYVIPLVFLTCGSGGRVECMAIVGDLIVVLVSYVDGPQVYLRSGEPLSTPSRQPVDFVLGMQRKHLALVSPGSFR